MTNQITASIELASPEDAGIVFGRLTLLVFDNPEMKSRGANGEHIMYQNWYDTVAECVEQAIAAVDTIAKQAGYEPGRIIIRPDAR